MTAYQYLVDERPQPDIVCEKVAGRYSALTEKHLQVLWWEQRWLRPLTTVAGLPLAVSDAGRWNDDSGPDFVKARLAINGVNLVGDIELHLHHEGWHAHRHHEDARYNGVVLHVALWGAPPYTPIITENGATVHAVVLEPFLQVTPARLEKLIDIDLYPRRAKLATGRCGQQLFRHQDVAATRFFFEEAALWRLRQKQLRLSLLCGAAEAPLPAALAYCIGLPHHGAAYAALYRWLRQRTGQHTVDALHALALAKVGLLDDGAPGHSAPSPQLLLLRRLAAHHDPGDAAQLTIRVERHRPTGHPTRRLFLLAALAADRASASWTDALNDIWRQYIGEDDEGAVRRLDKRLMDFVPYYEHPWWSHHYRLDDDGSTRPLPLAGKALRREWILNALLPALYGAVSARGDAAEREAFLRYYRTIPAQKYAIDAYLKSRFFEGGPADTLLGRSIYEQGALQLHGDFCAHYGDSCRGCPLVDRYRRRYPTGRAATTRAAHDDPTTLPEASACHRP